MAKNNISYAERNRRSIEKYGKNLYARRIERAMEQGYSRSQARGHAKKNETPIKKTRELLTKEENKRATESRGTSHNNFLKGVQTLVAKTNKSNRKQTELFVLAWRLADLEREEEGRREISIRSEYGGILNEMFNALDDSGRLYDYYY